MRFTLMEKVKAAELFMPFLLKRIQKHCAHISFAPQTDSDGVIKCQESEGIKVTDVFSEQDLDAIDKFCKKNKIEDVCGTILQ